MGHINRLRPVLSLQLDSMILKIFSNLSNSLLPAENYSDKFYYSDKCQQCQNMLMHNCALLGKALVYFNPSQ